MIYACPLCTMQNFLSWRFGLLQCEGCGLVVDKVLWRPAANEQLNESFFGDSCQIVRSFWVRWFEKLNNRRTLKRIRGVLGSRKGNLLEIGIGSGSFLEYARSQGFSPLGCDLSPALCRQIQHTTGIEIHCGTLESLPSQKSFDVVVMNHVLEHVPEPIALLKAVRARLNQGGLLHLAVPNVASWEAQMSGWNCYQPYHLTYFAPSTLRATVEKAGFSILKVTTHESFSGWFLAIFHSLTRKRYSQQALQGSNTNISRSAFLLEHTYRLAMATWGLITHPLRWLQAKLGKGDELIIVARHGDYD
jgi:2-polyprenyl-3-methyl-5-hydroxy-6-metoxy-1,4-benzoquinol methylase